MTNRDIVRWFADYDWLGINHFSPITPAQSCGAPRLRLGRCPAGGARSPIGWQIDPAAFRDTLLDAHERYGLPIYVLENGAGAVEKPDVSGRSSTRNASTISRNTSRPCGRRSYAVRMSAVTSFGLCSTISSGAPVMRPVRPRLCRLRHATADSQGLGALVCRLDPGGAIRPVSMTSCLLADVGGTWARFALLSGSKLGPIHALAVGAYASAVDAINHFVRCEANGVSVDAPSSPLPAPSQVVVARSRTRLGCWSPKS